MNIENFIKEYKKGVTDKILSQIFGISESSVLRLRRKLNLPRNSHKLIKYEDFIKYYSQNLIDKDIAQKLKVSKNCVQTYRTSLNLSKVDPLKKEKDKILKGELLLSPATRYRIKKEAGLVKSKFPEDINLTEEEFQVILGSLLGDGNISVRHPKKGGGILNIKHCLKQKDYCLYKQQMLKRLNPKYKENHRHDNRLKIKDYIESIFYTKSLKCLKNFYDRWYTPKKSICLNDFYKINALGLAIWYMDDGYKPKYGGCYLCTQSFSKEKLEQVILILKEKFNLDVNIRKDNILYINSKSFKIFKSLITPYIVPSMKYKLGKMSE